MIFEWNVLLKVILTDIVLSGDNAVLIALAASKLPTEQQKRAILYGTGGAIGLRLLFTLIIVWLLKIPFVQLAGGLLLVWIAYKLLAGVDEHNDLTATESFWGAIKTIVIADALMSLDNVMALAGVGHGNFFIIAIGILISIPIIIWGSSFLVKAMEKYPIISYIGAALLAWTAGEMIVEENRLEQFFESPILHYGIPAAIAVLVLLFGILKSKKT
jgi:YjbE family integral membrane protein